MTAALWNEPLPDDCEALKALIGQLRATLQATEAKLAWFTEQWRLAQLRRFAASREHCPEQGELFADLPVAELTPTEPTPADADEAEGPRRRGKRCVLPLNLPRERIIHDLADAEKVCRCCGRPLVCIGQAHSEQLDLVPPRLKVLEHIRLKYACRACESGIMSAPAPPQPIPKSLASPGLLAYVATAKYADGLSLYHLALMLRRWGAEVPRQTLAAWLIKAGQLVQPLINLLQEELLRRDIVQADETKLQVLKEPGRPAERQSTLWVFRSGCGPPVILFHYSETRAGKHAKAYLDGFSGEYLQSDGSALYDQVRSVRGRPRQLGPPRLGGAGAHGRRRFVAVIRARPKGAPPGLADEALGVIQQLYRIERQCRDLDAEERQHHREVLSRPRLRALKSWLQAHQPQVLPKSLLGGAFSYLLKQWPRLERYLEDGRLAIDNNATERTIRAYAIGRKRWLFAATPAGARTSAHLYSLVETAKANGLEPWAYLQRVFTVLPAAQTLEEVETLLPWRWAGEAHHG